MTKSTSEQSIGGQNLLNVRELAALLKVSATSVYRLVERRDIPFVRLPRGLRFSEADVEAFLARHRVEAVE
ncbi:helix-turn-helix domain-containing protein [Patescibacteria group bacterium]|nr:helix-turn-helix domain-containing protein [Patescibacteria group bacterium]